MMNDRQQRDNKKECNRGERKTVVVMATMAGLVNVRLQRWTLRVQDDQDKRRKRAITKAMMQHGWEMRAHQTMTRW